MTIYEKLNAIQLKLNAPKSQFNKFGGFYYRNCEDILQAAKPFLEEHKVILKLTDKISQIGDRYYIEAKAELIDVDKPEDKIETIAYAREEDAKKGMDGSQVTGAASSYARKYALNGLFAIDDAKDSDATNVIKCADCKKVIEKHDKFSAAQIASMSKKKYGRALCFNCSVKQKEANEKKAKEKEKKDA